MRKKTHQHNHRQESSQSSQDALFGIHAIEAILNKNPERIISIFTVSRSNKEKKNSRLEALLASAKRQGISCQQMSPNKMEAMVGAHHQGVIAHYRPSQLQTQDQLMQMVEDSEKVQLLVLDGVTDPHNYGACIRTAEALGMQGVVVAKDHSAPLNATVRKVASGAAEFLPLFQVTNLARMLAELREAYVQVVGASCNPEISIGLPQVEFSEKFAIVMGSEGKGLRSLTEKHCDHLAYIDMKGYINSLNVSVATGLFLYEAVGRNK